MGRHPMACRRPERGARLWSSRNCANFISGLIILFERPIRLGDTVTVGEFSGTVTRIRIRATTLVDWDNKEVVVPNKTFITERLVNWTLTDSVTRVVIPVGIGYGSDTELAHKIMLDLANEQNEVLDSPPRVLTSSAWEPVRSTLRSACTFAHWRTAWS